MTQHFLITGKVQGVYYRLSMQHKATELGLVGWVRNLSDGRVEALVSGQPQPMQALAIWLQQGPDRAFVDSVEVSDKEPMQFDTFSVLPDADCAHW